MHFHLAGVDLSKKKNSSVICSALIVGRSEIGTVVGQALGQ